jgi:hypothetical protein
MFAIVTDQTLVMNNHFYPIFLFQTEIVKQLCNCPINDLIVFTPAVFSPANLIDFSNIFLLNCENPLFTLFAKFPPFLMTSDNLKLLYYFIDNFFLFENCLFCNSDHFLFCELKPTEFSEHFYQLTVAPSTSICENIDVVLNDEFSIFFNINFCDMTNDMFSRIYYKFDETPFTDNLNEETAAFNPLFESLENFDNLTSITAVYHYSIPTTKLAYPEPFIASASFMHSDL